MGRFLHIVLGAALLTPALTTAGTAAAEEFPSGWYIVFGAGASAPTDNDIDGSGIKASAEAGWGMAFTGAVGHGLGKGLRAEAEAAYRSADIDAVSGTSGSGSLDAVSLMANLILDIDVDSVIVPHVGIGIGAARVDYDGVSPVGGSSVNGNDTTFAYQALAGIGYKVSDELMLSLDYRYMRTLNLGLATAAGAGIDAEYQNHTVTAGLIWSFGAPQPASPAATGSLLPEPEPRPEPKAMSEPEPMPKAKPAPAAEPEPAAQAPQQPEQQTARAMAAAPAEAARAALTPKRFQVLFGFAKAVLDRAAQDMVDSAARYAQSGRLIRINVTGHSDRMGAREYNAVLSMRRAETVRQRLIAQGVERNSIAIMGKGEDEPLIKTPDGVALAKNRRVEIVVE